MGDKVLKDKFTIHLLEMVTWQQYQRTFPTGIPSRCVSFELFVKEGSAYTVKATLKKDTIEFMVLKDGEVWHMFVR